MNAELRLVLETTDRILAGDEAGSWARFVDAGLHLLAVPEPVGAGWLEAAVEVTRLCGERGRGGTYGERALVALPLHPDAGAVALLDDPPVDGPPAGAVAARRVAGARDAERILLVGNGSGVLVPAVELTRTDGENLAGEPRDTLAGTVRAEPVEAADAQLRGALARSAAMAGAARGALTLTVTHVTTREQFGRPLARFQAVQQTVAAMAGEVEAMEAAVRAATAVCAADGFAATASRAAVAAAKVQAGRGGTAVARDAHQLHGAIGTTREHPLHRLTLRLLSWRDEYGAERHWQQVLATTLAGDPWLALTGD